MKKQNNDPTDLMIKYVNKEITPKEYYFRMGAYELGVTTYKENN